MLAAARRALAQIFSPPFRSVLLKSVGLTLAMLAAVWAAAWGTITHFATVSSPGLQTLIEIATGLGLLFGLGFLVAPVTSLFAGLFLDEIAAEVERVHYPSDPPGREMPLGPAVLSALRFTALVVVVNLLVLLLILLPGINIGAFFVANAYLLGREYFEQVAMRFHSRETVAELRRRHGTRIFLAGLVVALVLAIPLVNILTPLFATAFMVHVFKDVDRSTAGVSA